MTAVDDIASSLRGKTVMYKNYRYLTIIGGG